MKTYKQRTLDAQADLIRRYKENDPPEECPFCKIYCGPYSCDGCFMAGNRNMFLCGCTKTPNSIEARFMDGHTYKQRLARAKWHEKVRKIISKWPPSRFTPKGWEYYDWNRRENDYMR